ncbi:MAG: M48 family metallopeptidase [Bacteroidaceae bacterium]|nr:M48 family metallopeptidase [Bacteroidaceae bacterium]
MKRVKFLLTGAITLMMVVSCATATRVPITGRKQRLSVSDEQMLSLSATQYKEYLGSAKKSTNTKNTAMVQRVGQKLANAVTTYLSQNGYANEVKNYAWEFNLVQSNSVNAFCMPGGKIVVYEGMLAVTQDEASLAIVLGHEIAHAVAKHSAEQMSKQKNQSILTSLGASILAVKAGQEAANMATSLASTGLTFLNAHYSRDNESEADHMGLIFAAMAGYDPNTAISFWKRMSQASSGSASTSILQSYLSSHPSDAKRVTDIQRWLPEAMKYYTGK